MPTDVARAREPQPRNAPPTRRALWGELTILLLLAPPLTFPTFLPPLTLLALLAVIALWLWPLLRRRPLLPVTPFNAALLLWALALFMGILVTADPDLTLSKATNLILGLTLWRTLVRTVTNRRAFHVATGVYLAAGLGLTLFGLLNADWQLKAPAQVPLLRELTALLSTPNLSLAGAESGIHPNQVAGAITLFAPLLLALLAGWRARSGKPIVLGALLLGTLSTLLALLLTQSRSAWIGVLLAGVALVGMWALLLPPSRVRRAALGAVALIVVAGGVALVAFGPQRLQTLWEEPRVDTVVGSLATLSYRQAVWPWALSAISDFPLTGTGLGSFRRVVERLYPIQIPLASDVGHAHNVFLQTAVDVGLPGLVAYLALLLIAGALCWQLARRDGGIRPFTLGFFASLLAFHLFGLFDALAPGARPGLLLWWLLGLVAAAAALLQPAPTSHNAVGK